MNKVHPLYFLLLAGFFLIFSAHMAKKQNQELDEAVKNFHTTQQLALKLSALKKSYSSKNKEVLVRYLGSSRFKKDGILLQAKKNSLKITAKETSLKTLNLIVSKLLNTTCEIRTFIVKRAKKGSYELQLEILW